MLGGISLIPHIWLRLDNAETGVRVITAILHGAGLVVATIFVVGSYHGWFAEAEKEI
jgi:hypothetical protein